MLLSRKASVLKSDVNKMKNSSRGTEWGAQKTSQGNSKWFRFSKRQHKRIDTSMPSRMFLCNLYQKKKSQLFLRKLLSFFDIRGYHSSNLTALLKHPYLLALSSKTGFRNPILNYWLVVSMPTFTSLQNLHKWFIQHKATLLLIILNNLMKVFWASTYIRNYGGIDSAKKWWIKKTRNRCESHSKNYLGPLAGNIV